MATLAFIVLVTDAATCCATLQQLVLHVSKVLMIDK